MQIREILNTKEVGEKSGKFLNFGPKYVLYSYFDYLKCEKMCLFFLSLTWLARSYENLLILEHSVPRNYLRILFVSFVELGRYILVS